MKISNYCLNDNRGKQDIMIEWNPNITNTTAPPDLKPNEDLAASMVNIAQLTHIASEQLVTVKAKVHSLGSVKKLSTKKGLLRKQEAILVDWSASIKLFLWENHTDTVEVGNT